MLHSTTQRSICVATLTWSILFALPGKAFGEDWPEWRGAGRRGEWNESGIVRIFPKEGLRVVWRVPLGSGYSGPSVSRGRVFASDFLRTGARLGSEGLVAFDQETGERLWEKRWPADYAGIEYPSGPRATPTVDGDRVYAVGASGTLVCASVEDGQVLWTRTFTGEFGTQLPPWGMSSAPVVHGDLLIAVVAGRPDAKVVAFDKHTGAEVWRALSSENSGPGYSQPILIQVGIQPAVVIWHAGGVAALEPDSGRLLWEQPFRIRMETPIATPAWRRPLLLVSAFFNGSRLYHVGSDGTALLWKGSSDSGVETDGLHALMNAPVIDGDHVYGICSYGQLRCLQLSTGKRVWETQEVTRERVRNASAFVVRSGDRYFISNDRGELIIAGLSPSGYTEFCRTELIRPTSEPGARRERGAVHWSHPAYAERSVFVRNDEEILRASLAAD